MCIENLDGFAHVEIILWMEEKTVWAGCQFEALHKLIMTFEKQFWEQLIYKVYNLTHKLVKNKKSRGYFFSPIILFIYVLFWTINIRQTNSKFTGTKRNNVTWNKQ